jgi:hypothetical protein
MINIIPTSKKGITSGVDTIIKLIQDNPNELINVGRVNDGDDNYSFIALFLEKGTIAQYVAFLQEWGTNDGVSGEGEGGFIRMNVFLSEKKIDVIDFQLSNQDYKKIGYLKSSVTDLEERFTIWQKYIYEMIEYSMK